MANTVDFLELLNYAVKGAKLAHEALANRQPFPLIATVADNNDPEGRRRVKVYDPTKGNQYQTEWLLPLRIMPTHDTPMPRVNDTVLLIFINGDPQDALYLPYTNQINAPLEKENPIDDLVQQIPGNNINNILGRLETTVKGALTKYVESTAEEYYNAFYKLYSKAETLIDAATQLTLTGQQLARIASTGCSITLANGVITWSWAGGTKTMVMGSDGNLTIDMGGGQFNIVNANGLTVNNKSITTIGAVDSRGDTLTTKGW